VEECCDRIQIEATPTNCATDRRTFPSCRASKSSCSSLLSLYQSVGVKLLCSDSRIDGLRVTRFPPATCRRYSAQIECTRLTGFALRSSTTAPSACMPLINLERVCANDCDWKSGKVHECDKSHSSWQSAPKCNSTSCSSDEFLALMHLHPSTDADLRLISTSDTQDKMTRSNGPATDQTRSYNVFATFRCVTHADEFQVHRHIGHANLRK
jgi:hypothetical protein